KGVVIVVETMQGEDHRLRLALSVGGLRQPFAQWQSLAVGGDEASLGKARRGLRIRYRARRADASEPDLLVSCRGTAGEQKKSGEHPESAKVGCASQSATPYKDRMAPSLSAQPRPRAELRSDAGISLLRSIAGL